MSEILSAIQELRESFVKQRKNAPVGIRRIWAGEELMDIIAELPKTGTKPVVELSCFAMGIEILPRERFFPRGFPYLGAVELDDKKRTIKFISRETRHV